jgi:hypothetical protein
VSDRSRSCVGSFYKLYRIVLEAVSDRSRSCVGIVLEANLDEVGLFVVRHDERERH